MRMTKQWIFEEMCIGLIVSLESINYSFIKLCKVYIKGVVIIIFIFWI